MKFIILIISFVLMACASSDKAEFETPLKVIDVHNHTAFTGKPTLYGKANTKEEWLAQRQEANIVGGVSHAAAEQDPKEFLADHNVIHCAGVSAKPDLKRLEARLQSKKFNCIKVYLGYQYQWANHPNYLKVYKIAEKFNVPVVFHTGDTLDTDGKVKYSDPLTIDEIAVDFRKVNFVIAHCGNPWLQSAAEVAYKNANVYLECSALLVGDLTKTDPESVNKLLVEPINWIFRYVENPTKIMFGTDWPLVSMSEYLKHYKRAIPQEHWQAVFHDNAARVFKLK